MRTITDAKEYVEFTIATKGGGGSFNYYAGRMQGTFYEGHGPDEEREQVHIDVSCAELVEAADAVLAKIQTPESAKTVLTEIFTRCGNIEEAQSYDKWNSPDRYYRACLQHRRDLAAEHILAVA